MITVSCLIRINVTVQYVILQIKYFLLKMFEICSYLIFLLNIKKAMKCYMDVKHYQLTNVLSISKNVKVLKIKVDKN